MKVVRPRRDVGHAGDSMRRPCCCKVGLRGNPARRPLLSTVVSWHSRGILYRRMAMRPSGSLSVMVLAAVAVLFAGVSRTGTARAQTLEAPSAPAPVDYIGHRWHAGLAPSVQVVFSTQTDTGGASGGGTGANSNLGFGFWLDAPVVGEWLRVEVGADLYPAAPDLPVYALAKFVFRPSFRVQPWVGIGPAVELTFGPGASTLYGAMAAVGLQIWLSDRVGITGRIADTYLTNINGPENNLLFDFGVVLGF